MKPLENIRVLELGRMYAAPWAAMLLGDMGAEVIKIESPATGDPVRAIDDGRISDASGEKTDSGRFAAINRNKKSITVDISTPTGQSIVRRLAAKSDVFIENFKVGDLARRRLDYASIRNENEKIIYASITGFGQSGPYRQRPAIDPVAQGFSGYMAINGEVGQPPLKTTFSVMDFTTGMFTAHAIMSSLYHQKVNNGPGQHLDIALMDSAMSIMSYLLVPSLIEGRQPEKLGSRVLPGWAPGGVFECSDGMIYMTTANTVELGRFAKVIGRPELPEDPRFATQDRRAENEDLLNAIAESAFREGTMLEWVDRLADAGILAAPIYEFGHIPNDPQVIARDLVFHGAHAGGATIPFVRSPIRMSETPIVDYSSAPLLGQHTQDVLKGILGISETEFAEYAAEGAI